ncbi:hypothetical protein COV04_02485 [Candidatus Uhrbacteria bacterium CG10_big_fil_rev_8_21_14_0_10_48_11]|uniref:M23ase beta-sheet core domain-containing protein n=1 Tax=Candidatus Uhrbacteria bacterium CG10_big_fil_rev_8_21_14_0_10_48_11 TaxID=1975037 RepID=A0A2M8LEB3_9BACT|nr:MAG: hypothetical protein COV04_02485 [Candidatus Uhrbacteria bacterium CG10_big_fil_rev_8_21_14_0_10_48_11]
MSRKVFFITTLFILLGTLVSTVNATAKAADSPEVNALQQQINAKQEEIKKLEDTAAEYQKSLKQKQSETRTLANQMGILSDEISKTQVGIEAAQLNIEKVNLEINSVENQIKDGEQKVKTYRGDLGALLRYIVREKSRSPLQALFTTENFFSFYGRLQNLHTLQNRMDNLIVQVKAEQEALAEEKQLVENKRGELISAADDLHQQSLDLSDQQSLKSYLLKQTKSSEQKFADLLQQVKDQQEQATRAVAALEQTVRDKLRSHGIETNGPAPRLIWPVPKNKITTRFHDPDYPFNYLFTHDAIDIRAAQGTPILAAASGYVAKVRTGNPSNYWYVVLVNDGGLTTVYGHVSKVFVSVDTFVTQGQVIALSGATPGKPGTGPYSTGPHLHFEVHDNGIVVDPKMFLP